MTVLQDLALGRGNLDRLGERRGDTFWLDEIYAHPDTFIVGVSGGEIALDENRLRNCTNLPFDATRAALLGSAGGVTYVALMLDDAVPGSRSLREVGHHLSDNDAAIATTAVALHQWHRNHTHCSRCGAETVNALAGWERHCVVDASAHYPRTDPAVIIAIVDDADRLLLARQTIWPAKRYSIVAGYVEPGETAEHAVHREILEEVHLRVHTLEYLGSQPWPFPASLMLCYRAHAIGSDFRVDGVEIEHALWVTRDELAAKVRSGELLLPSKVSIARRAIEHWHGDLASLD
jgi:NAD+ diphosphatase